MYVSRRCRSNLTLTILVGPTNHKLVSLEHGAILTGSIFVLGEWERVSIIILSYYC